jgi:hypothetical protein
MAKKAAKKTTKAYKSASRNQLAGLLDQAAKLFSAVTAKKKILFQLAYKRDQWKFEVVNCWSLWMEKHFLSDFPGNTPEEAVQRFLDYCTKHNIDPAEFSLPD